MMNITLKQLRYFIALCEHGHFGRAADSCAISQPALSVQIKELEETLGLVLFERSARHVRLTSFGEDLASRSRSILRAVEELGDLAQAAKQGWQGSLRLGVIPTVAPYLLPQLIPALSARYAALDIQMRETVTPRLLTELQDGRLDAALVALPVDDPSLEAVEIATEPFYLVRPLAEAAAPVPSVAELQNMRLLLLEEGHCFRDQAAAYCAMQPRFSQQTQDGSSLSTLVQMVGAGLGITLVPQMAVAVERRAAQVCVQPLPPEPGADTGADTGPERQLALVWRRSSPLAEKLKEIAEIAREACARQNEERH